MTLEGTRLAAAEVPKPEIAAASPDQTINLQYIRENGATLERGSVAVKLGERPTRTDLVTLVGVGAGMALFFVAPVAAIATAPDPRLGDLLPQQHVHRLGLLTPQVLRRLTVAR